MKRLTIEAIADDPWNAVNLALPANATEYLLKIARAAAFSCLRTQYAKMDDPDRAGENGRFRTGLGQHPQPAG